MIILPQKCTIKWSYNNRKYYESKGYVFTKYNDYFDVDVLDLSKCSSAYIKIKCDYCGEEYSIKHHRYNSTNKKIVNKDCCKKCSDLKRKESTIKLYGVENVFQLKEMQDKMKIINIEKYGVENVFYLKEFQDKAKQTCLEKYGVEYYNQTEKSIEQRVKSFYKNGSCRTSSQQLEIFNILKDNNYNVELNLPVSRCNLDIALHINNINIDIEYDGWHWHDSQRDRKRDEFLKSQGWKVFRIKSGHKIPSLKQIQEGIFKLINTDRTYTQIVLDDWKEEIV